jgi:hypothetical protein
MISSHRTLNVFGCAALVALFVTQWFFSVNLISVWCFFVALLSICILLFFLKKPVAARLVDTG